MHQEGLIRSRDLY